MAGPEPVASVREYPRVPAPPCWVTMPRNVRGLAASTVGLVLLVATSCGGDVKYAGLTRGEATRLAKTRIEAELDPASVRTTRARSGTWLLSTERPSPGRQSGSLVFGTAKATTAIARLRFARTERTTCSLSPAQRFRSTDASPRDTSVRWASVRECPPSVNRCISLAFGRTVTAWPS